MGLHHRLGPPSPLFLPPCLGLECRRHSEPREIVVWERAGRWESSISNQPRDDRCVGSSDMKPVQICNVEKASPFDISTFLLCLFCGRWLWSRWKADDLHISFLHARVFLTAGSFITRSIQPFYQLLHKASMSPYRFWTAAKRSLLNGNPLLFILPPTSQTLMFQILQGSCMMEKRNPTGIRALLRLLSYCLQGFDE